MKRAVQLLLASFKAFWRMADAAGQHGLAHLRERGVDAVHIPAGAERAVIIVPVAPSHHMRGEMAAAGIGTAAPPPTNALRILMDTG